MADIWRVHPFREGNTRAISAFAFLLLRQYGHTFNAELIKGNAKYFRNALVMASLKEYAEYQYLQKILVDSIGEDNIVTSSDKYKKIKDYNVEDYTYVYHKVK
jgi:cell filamentation protein